MNQTVKRQSFLHGATILIASTAIVKIIGALFRIPLYSLIGATGFGYFSTAYELYLPIYSLAMAGLPIAVSRIVSESVVENRYKDAREFRRISQKMFLVSGLAGMFIIGLISIPFVTVTGNNNALPSVLLTAPSLLFCCVMASYRGYYEGLRNMYPTAISSVIEALGKLIIGLGGAYLTIMLGMKEFAASGTVFGQTVKPMEGATLEAVAKQMTLPYAAAAAIGGITLGTLFGAIYLILRHKIKGDEITRSMLYNSIGARPRKENFNMILAISIPIVIGSLAQNISGLVDVVQVQRQLSNVVAGNTNFILNMYKGRIDPGTGVDKIAVFLYGCYKGGAYSIYNLVPTITSVLGVSALPALSTAWTEKNKNSIRSNLETVVRISALFVLPAGIGMSVLSGPILNLVYPSTPNTNSIATPILTILGFTAIFAGLTMPITNMLQAIGKQKIPVRNMIIGVILKVAVNFVLVGIPAINIVGAPVGTLVCYTFLFFSNFFALCKHSKVKPDFMSILIKPLISALMCGAAAYVSYPHFARFLKDINTRLPAIAAILTAAVVYFIALILLRAIKKEDVLTLPKGEKIAKFLEKCKIIA